MESLSETKWDVLISGTGFAQSLLALALSRSNKKVLHIDRNNIYGGGEAALSLQDAENFEDLVAKSSQSLQYPFESAKVIHSDDPQISIATGLRSSRSYALSLSPQLIYTQARLIPILVSSHVYQTLEFQAVGNWWIAQPVAHDKAEDVVAKSPIDLKKIPSGREDVFADDSINRRSKMSLMKFLRHLMRNSSEDGEDVPKNVKRDNDNSRTFAEMMSTDFNLSETLYEPLLALSLSPKPASQTSAEFALDRIRRHISSIGVFGPGFGSLIVKWGGLSEIAQASCRALAVGGGVYVLGQGIEDVRSVSSPEESNEASPRLAVSLTNGEALETQWIIGGPSDIPGRVLRDEPTSVIKSARAIYIVSSALDHLFLANSESGPSPAGVLVVFPATPSRVASESLSGPLYLIVHSSDTGECPNGQCVIYAATAFESQETNVDDVRNQLNTCVQALLESCPSQPGDNGPPRVLWTMHYIQRGLSTIEVSSREMDHEEDSHAERFIHGTSGFANLLVFPASSLDLAFDDTVIDQVKDVWKMIMGNDVNEEGFLRFESREGPVDE